MQTGLKDSEVAVIHACQGKDALLGCLITATFQIYQTLFYQENKSKPLRKEEYNEVAGSLYIVN